MDLGKLLQKRRWEVHYDPEMGDAIYVEAIRDERKSLLDKRSNAELTFLINLLKTTLKRIDVITREED